MRRNKTIKLGIDYEAQVPHCGSCVHFRLRSTQRAGNQTHTRPPLCLKHTFHPSFTGVCKDWTGRDGSTLMETT